MGFDDVIGQVQVKQKLFKAMKEDTLSHAYIFIGSQGIGKKLMAMNLAKKVICTSNDNTPCHHCLACKLFEAGTNPDFMFISAEGQNILVDDIRKIQSDATIRPMYSNKKVYIIADGDKMTIQAQNSLLKTLEEPPEYCLIIITSANPDKLLETIRSRVLKIVFAKNSKDEIKLILDKSNAQISANNQFVLDYCDGVPGKALELCASDVFITLRDKTFESLEKLYSDKINGTSDFVDFIAQNKENIDAILNLMLIFYRDLYINKKKLEHLINSDKKGMILKYSTALSVETILHSIEAIEETRRQIRQNANFELALEVMLMEMMKG